MGSRASPWRRLLTGLFLGRYDGMPPFFFFVRRSKKGMGCRGVGSWVLREVRRGKSGGWKFVRLCNLRLLVLAFCWRQNLKRVGIIYGDLLQVLK